MREEGTRGDKTEVVGIEALLRMRKVPKVIKQSRHGISFSS